MMTQRATASQFPACESHFLPKSVPDYSLMS